jgi:hypothetical protein
MRRQLRRRGWRRHGRPGTQALRQGRREMASAQERGEGDGEVAMGSGESKMDQRKEEGFVL